MILGEYTQDGILIDSLTHGSKKKVLKQCDNCSIKKYIPYLEILKCRIRRNSDLDFCHACAMKLNSGDKNSSKREDIRKLISEKTKGKSKKFKDGINLRILPRKITTSGYLLEWSDDEKTHIPQHRLVVSRINPLLDNERVHHINGEKMDNKISNLHVCKNSSEHQSIHNQLLSVAFELVKQGNIKFNTLTGTYYISDDILKLERSFGFENIAIRQKKNIVNSRLNVNTSSEIIRGVWRDVPLIAANMSTVINPQFYIELYKIGALGILHRANDTKKILDDLETVARECDVVAGSIGITMDQFDLAKQMIHVGCNVLCIDVAHGYSDSVLELAKKLKYYAPTVKIIIGNTTNVDLLYESYKFVDAIKVGIAQGFACETKNTAGCTEKQFSAVLKFKEISKEFQIPIISDGAISEPADFVKSIAAGANSAMAGKIFAMCPESAAEIVTVDGVQKKLYAGMASRYVQEKWRGVKEGTCTEGGIRYLDIGESVKFLIERYLGALRSGITYAGGNDISSFQSSVNFIRVS